MHVHQSVVTNTPCRLSAQTVRYATIAYVSDSLKPPNPSGNFCRSFLILSFALVVHVFKYQYLESRAPVSKTYVSRSLYHSGHIAATMTSFRLETVSIISQNTSWNELTPRISNADHRSLLAAQKLQSQSCRGRQRPSGEHTEVLRWLEGRLQSRGNVNE